MISTRGEFMVTVMALEAVAPEVALIVAGNPMSTLALSGHLMVDDEEVSPPFLHQYLDFTTWNFSVTKGRASYVHTKGNHMKTLASRPSTSTPVAKGMFDTKESNCQSIRRRDINYLCRSGDGTHALDTHL
jgi:hypothetical protein